MKQTMTELGVLAQLRVLAGSEVSPVDGLALADRQARLLREITSRQSQSLDELVAGLPHLRVQLADIPVSGITYWDGKEWVITVNEGESRTRQRFTIMHEFKHIIDHPFAQTLYHSDGQGRLPMPEAERCADYFSGCALVPTRLLRDAWHGGATDPTELASLFDVSVPAMQVRLQQINLARSQPCREALPSPLQSGHHLRHSKRLAA